MTPDDSSLTPAMVEAFTALPLVEQRLILLDLQRKLEVAEARQAKAPKVKVRCRKQCGGNVAEAMDGVISYPVLGALRDFPINGGEKWGAEDFGPVCRNCGAEFTFNAVALRVARARSTGRATTYME